MKKHLIFYLFVFFAVAACKKEEDLVTPFTADLKKVMNASIEKMQSSMTTKNPERDFTAMMIEHHQGAIEMAKLEVKEGKDTRIKGMAQEMISAQQAEITTLRNLLPRYTQTRPNDQFNERLVTAVSAMKHKMEEMMKAKSVDGAFASMMIVHHESAIEMAQAVILYSDDSQLKQVAYGIIGEQGREVAELREWLNQHK